MKQILYAAAAAGCCCLRAGPSGGEQLQVSKCSIMFGLLAAVRIDQSSSTTRETHQLQ